MFIYNDPLRRDELVQWEEKGRGRPHSLHPSLLACIGRHAFLTGTKLCRGTQGKLGCQTHRMLDGDCIYACSSSWLTLRTQDSSFHAALTVYIVGFTLIIFELKSSLYNWYPISISCITNDLSTHNKDLFYSFVSVNSGKCSFENDLHTEKCMGCQCPRMHLFHSVRLLFNTELSCWALLCIAKFPDSSSFVDLVISPLIISAFLHFCVIIRK